MIIFLDLDDTLLDRNTTYRIVNRKDQTKVYKELDESVTPLLTGIWRKYKLPVKSMGKDYWLSELVWNQIKAKHKNLELEDLSILIEDQGFKLKEESDFTDMLKHMANVDGEIRLFANMHLENKEDYLQKVQELVLKITQKEVSKVHYLDDVQQDSTNPVMMKLRIMLEAMTGHKIKMNRFTSTVGAGSPTVRYYNSDKGNVKQMSTIQDVLEALLKRTEGAVQLTIKGQLEQRPAELQLCLITPNVLKPFQTSRIKLMFPRYIKKFESFLLKAESFAGFCSLCLVLFVDGFNVHLKLPERHRVNRAPVHTHAVHV